MQYKSVLTGAKTILGAVRNLLFGFDFFISYGQEPTSLLYVRRLADSLTSRDFVVFQDERSILAGDQLSIVIRMAIRRTKTLVVIGTDKAAKSPWVLREVSAFRNRKRDPVAIDLQQLRQRRAWGELDSLLGDTLVLDDMFEGPSQETVDAVARSFAGRRANQKARFSVVLVSITLIVLTSFAMFTTLQLFRRTEALRREAIVSLARSVPDPVTQLLLLGELPKDGYDYRVDAIARGAAKKWLPAFIMRNVPQGLRSVSFTPDSKHLVCLDSDGGLWLCPLTGEEPRLLATKLQAPNSMSIQSNQGRICLLGSRDLTVCTEDGAVASLTISEGKASNSARDAHSLHSLPIGPDRSEQGTNDDTPWRLSSQSGVALALSSRSVQFYDLVTRKLVLEFTIGGRSPLDATVEGFANSWRATILCTDGTLWQVTAPQSKLNAPKLLGRMVADGGSVRLPETIHGASRAFGASAHFAVALDDHVPGHSIQSDHSCRILAYNLAQNRLNSYTVDEKLQFWQLSDDGQRILLVPEWAKSTPRRSVLDLDSGRKAYEPTALGVEVLSQVDYLNGAKLLSDEDSEPALNRAIFSPDGNRVILPGPHSSLLWSVHDSRVKELVGKNLLDGTAVFNHGGDLVAIPEFGSVRIWRTAEAASEGTDFALPGDVISCDEVAPNLLLAVCSNGSALSLDFDLGKSTELYSLGRGSIRQASVTLHNRLLLVYSDNSELSLVNATTGKISWSTRVVDADPTAKEGYFRVNEAGNCYLVVNKQDIYRVDLQNGKLTRVAKYIAIEHFELSRFADVVYFDDANKNIMRMVGGINRPEPLYKAADTIWELVASPDGKSFGAGLYGKAVLWDERSGARDIAPHSMDKREDIDALTWDTDHVYAGTGRGALISVNKTGNELRFVSPELRTSARGAVEGAMAHVGVIYDIVRPDHRDLLLSLGGMDGTMRVWDTSGKLISKISITDTPETVKFISNGKYIMYCNKSAICIRCTFAWDLVHIAIHRMNCSLVPSQRIRYLGESEGEARAHYEACERGFGRKPLRDDQLLDVDVAF